ncbi:hypothetical protein [Piscinibacter terrae]|uniref:Uncharacterized protein n=1 Tax=Piscinibacter terrae TaxID=2496871 RepID=A0A3N7K3A2_9BURK|nr:hypothetical protein [Albitalea terrae]RQP25425.1 hypothetical protein DZC73_11445 [Albitalea terrae]
MSRIIKRPGDVLKVPLSAVGLHAYAQWLPDGTVRVFLNASKSELSIGEVVLLPVAFRVAVFKDTPNRYGWSKLGNAPVPQEYSEPQRYAKKDVLSGRLSAYFEGKETIATAEELRGLETLAVWAHPHIVERLEAQLEGRESIFLKSLKVVA